MIDYLQNLDPLSLFVLILGVIVLLVVPEIFWLRSRKRRRQAKLETPSATHESEVEAVKKSTEPAITPAPVRKRIFGKALQNWIPLLRSKNKDKDAWERVLIESDMGPKLSGEIITALTSQAEDPEVFLKSRLLQMIAGAENKNEPWKDHKPWVCFMVGVNGVGKTTTTVKLGNYLKNQGLKVGLIGADTFRKAAIEQLERGAEKVGLDFFSLMGSNASEGADPSAVIFDGLKKFSDQDVILVDTSGRLHTKKNLMEELRKMKRVADKSLPGAPHAIWLVVDSTLGQNAVQQGRIFHESVELTGLLLTKTDGLSRGGTVFQLFQELKVPIRFVGFGETPDDLSPFDAKKFVEELFDEESSSS